MSRRTVPAVESLSPYELKGKVSRAGRNVTFDRATFDGFVNFMAKLGLGADNQISQGHYTFGPFLSRNRQELEAAYRSSWVVGKVVDVVAEDMTKKPPEIVSQIPPGDVAVLNRQMARLRVWHSLAEAIKWARLFGGGLAVMLIDGQRLNTPLRLDTIGKGQFRGFLVLDRWLVMPALSDLVRDLGPDYGTPRFYEIVGDASVLPNTRIHHSRVVRFDGIMLNYYGRLMENLWGISEIERMHDRLIAFDSVTHGAAQLVFKAHLRVIGVKGFRSALSLGGKDEQAVIKMFEYIRLMQTNEGLTLLDADDQFFTHQYAFSGLSDMLIQFGQQIAGATGIPLVRLFGMSPAGLNATGESDLRNYYDTINGLQESRLRPQLAEKVYPVMFRSAFGAPCPEDFDFLFPPLWQMQDKEKVETAKTVSDAVNDAYNSGIIGRKTALKELKHSSKITGVWTNITDDQIASAEEEPEKTGETGLEGVSLEEPEFTPGQDERKPGEAYQQANRSFMRRMIDRIRLRGEKRVLDDTSTFLSRKTCDWNESDHPRDGEGKFSVSGAAKSKNQRLAETAMKNPELDIPNLVSGHTDERQTIEKGIAYYREHLIGRQAQCPALGEPVLFDEKGLEHLRERNERDQARRFALLPKALGVIENTRHIDPEDVEERGEGYWQFGLIGRFKDGTVVKVVLDEEERNGKRFLSIYDIFNLRGDKLARRAGE